jgi:hypothetical protein
VTDIIPIANFRTRLEAELAARLLEGAAVPYIINSPEGMLHGPLGDGATILVRTEDVEMARDALAHERPSRRGRVARVATSPTAEAAARVREVLHRAGIPALSLPDPARSDGAEAHGLFVPRAHLARARRVIQTELLDES